MRKPNSPWKSYIYVFWPLTQLKSQPTTTNNLTACKWAWLWMIPDHGLWTSANEAEWGRDGQSLSSPSHTAYFSANSHYFKLLSLGEACYRAEDNRTCLYSSDRQINVSENKNIYSWLRCWGKANREATNRIVCKWIWIVTLINGKTMPAPKSCFPQKK